MHNSNTLNLLGALSTTSMVQLTKAVFLLPSCTFDGQRNECESSQVCTESGSEGQCAGNFGAKCGQSTDNGSIAECGFGLACHTTAGGGSNGDGMCVAAVCLDKVIPSMICTNGGTTVFRNPEKNCEFDPCPQVVCIDDGGNMRVCKASEICTGQGQCGSDIHDVCNDDTQGTRCGSNLECDTTSDLRTHGDGICKDLSNDASVECHLGDIISSCDDHQICTESNGKGSCGGDIGAECGTDQGACGLNLECDITSNGSGSGNGICIAVDPVVCLEGAMECTDGTTVFRNPKSNCEFDPCPELTCKENDDTTHVCEASQICTLSDSRGQCAGDVDAVCNDIDGCGLYLKCEDGICKPNSQNSCVRGDIYYFCEDGQICGRGDCASVIGGKCNQDKAFKFKKVCDRNLQCDITSNGRGPGNGICIAYPEACPLDLKVCLDGNTTVGRSRQENICVFDSCPLETIPDPSQTDAFLSDDSDALSSKIGFTTSLFIVASFLFVMM